MKSIPKSSPSSVCGREYIPITCSKHVVNVLVSYLKVDPGLNTLPLYWLPDETLQFTEGHLIVPYKNIPEGCWITLESIQSMIDGDGVYVAWTLLENYYGLLRKQFKSDDSSVTIPHLNSVECIYQVSDIFHELQKIDQLFTDNLFHEMLRDTEVDRIKPSSMTTKLMMFPFYYVPDSHHLLAVVLPDIPYIYFLDTLPNSNRQQLFSTIFPILLSSYLKNYKSSEWVFTWVHEKKQCKKQPITLYLYVSICTLLWNSINKGMNLIKFSRSLCLSINQPCMKGKYDRRLPYLYWKNLSHLALSLDRCGFHISQRLLLSNSPGGTNQFIEENNELIRYFG